MFDWPRVPIRCSYCHCDTTAWIPSEGAEEVDVGRGEIRALFDVTTDDGEGALGWCDECAATLLFEYRDGTLHLSSKVSTDDRIAEPARSFLNQAKLSLHDRDPRRGLHAAKDGAVLARRAVRAACIERGANHGDIVFQIETLAGKGEVPTEFVTWARETPVIAYDGFRPEDCEITAEVAKDVVAVAERFLVALYGREQ